MSMSFKASPDGTYGEILVNGQAVAKLPVSGNAVIPGLVGTVSQSGGIPTGAVVERGSNANGDYVRFADGTQICARAISIDFSSTAFVDDVAWSAVFIGAPASFAGSVKGSFGQYQDAITSLYVGSTDSVFGYALKTTATAYANPVVFVAIGRWF